MSTLKSGIPKLIAMLENDVDDLLHENALDYVHTAQQPGMVPVRRGWLRDSGHVEEVPDGWAAIFGDPPRVDYAPYVHHHNPWMYRSIPASAGGRAQRLGQLRAKIEGTKP